jgi:DNA invertase Pin-like site-specific DNA recombinase
VIKRSHQTIFLFSRQIEKTMQVIGYIRVSTEEQDLQKQEHLLLKYAQQHEMQITDFIQVEISSRKNTKERRIDELLVRLNEGDMLLVAELSRLGRNMFEVINLINQLSERRISLFSCASRNSPQVALMESCFWLSIVTSLKRSGISFRCAPSRG